MVRSNCNFLYSIRRVRSLSSAKYTPGPDDYVFFSLAKRMKLFYELQAINPNEWSSKPVKRIYIPKDDGRKRPWVISNSNERVLQGVIKNALEPEWEHLVEPSNYGFRPGKTVWDATNRVIWSTTCLLRKTKFGFLKLIEKVVLIISLTSISLPNSANPLIVAY